MGLIPHDLFYESTMYNETVLQPCTYTFRMMSMLKRHCWRTLSKTHVSKCNLFNESSRCLSLGVTCHNQNDTNDLKITTKKVKICHSASHRYQTLTRENDPITKIEKKTLYTKEHVNSTHPTVTRLLDGLKSKKRAALAESITLAESTHPTKKACAQVLLAEIMEYNRQKRKHSLHKSSSFRIGKRI